MPTTTDLKQLIINTVESQEVYDYLKTNGLINEDEIYLVAGSFSGDIDCGLFTDTTTN